MSKFKPGQMIGRKEYFCLVLKESHRSYFLKDTNWINEIEHTKKELEYVINPPIISVIFTYGDIDV